MQSNKEKICLYGASELVISSIAVGNKRRSKATNSSPPANPSDKKAITGSKNKK